jgi:hypothetical protein
VCVCLLVTTVWWKAGRVPRTKAMRTLEGIDRYFSEERGGELISLQGKNSRPKLLQCYTNTPPEAMTDSKTPFASIPARNPKLQFIKQ